MRQGVGLEKALLWSSQAAAQRAAAALCRGDVRRAAPEAGAAVEYAAKATVARMHGPSAVLVTGKQPLSADEQWVLGLAESGPSGLEVERTDAARRRILGLTSIKVRSAVRRATVDLSPDQKAMVRTACEAVCDERNAVVHLGDTTCTAGELGDAVLAALDGLWRVCHVAPHECWGNFAEVAIPGVLGRLNTPQLDRAARCALARERRDEIGVMAVARAQDLLRPGRPCEICGCSAFVDERSRDIPPPPINARQDGTVRWFHCVVCGLVLWGDEAPPAAP